MLLPGVPPGPHSLCSHQRNRPRSGPPSRCPMAEVYEESFPPRRFLLLSDALPSPHSQVPLWPRHCSCHQSHQALIAPSQLREIALELDPLRVVPWLKSMPGPSHLLASSSSLRLSLLLGSLCLCRAYIVYAIRIIMNSLRINITIK